jgi:hypothetical protein
MLIDDDQSWNVYENKRKRYKMTAQKSDIYGNLTRILQKNSESDGQLSLIDTFRGGFFVEIRSENLPLPRPPAEPSAYSVSKGKPQDPSRFRIASPPPS